MPLLLYACNFEGLVFNRPPQAHETTRQHFRAAVDGHLVQAALAAAIEERLANDAVTEAMAKGPGRHAPPRHVKLLSRASEPPLAERFAKFGRQIDAPRAPEERRTVHWSAEERAANAVLSQAPVVLQGHELALGHQLQPPAGCTVCPEGDVVSRRTEHELEPVSANINH